MNERTGLLGDAWRVVASNKRYIFWFWILNLTLAEFGTAAYRNTLHAVLDHSLYADKLLHGFNPTTFIELLMRPETGPLRASEMPAMYFSLVFMAASVFLIPGVFRQYTSEYRVSREEFFRTCGRNLWRFLRLVLIYAVIAGPLAGILFGIRGALAKATEKSTNELLPFYVGLTALIVIFLVLTTVRVWFDLAEVDVVVRDQGMVRKAIGSGLRYCRRFWGRLLGSYVAISLVALLVLVAGVWLWHALVPANSVLGAILMSQIMLILWLFARFWQRAVASVFYLREMLVVPGFSHPAVTDPALPAAVPARNPGTGL
jgi:hypothetical protein